METLEPLVYTRCEASEDDLDWFRQLDGKVRAYLALPPCVRCRKPTHDEYTDPYWWEAGERMCDDCAHAIRPVSPQRKRRSRRKADGGNPAVRDPETGRWVPAA